MKTWLIVVAVLVIIVQSIISTNATASKIPLSELDQDNNNEDEDIAKEKIIQTLRTKKSTSSKKTSKVRAPQYMWDLYNTIADKATGRIKGGASNFLIKHDDRKFQCDLIQGIRSVEGGHSWSQGIGHFVFDMSDVTEDRTANLDNIVAAELVLSRKSLNANEVADLHLFYYVEIEQIMSNKSTQLMSKHLIYTNGNGTRVTFDVLTSIRSWISNQSRNLGLRVVIKTSDGKLVTSNGISRRLFKTRSIGNFRPLLVVYSYRGILNGNQPVRDQNAANVRLHGGDLSRMARSIDSKGDDSFDNDDDDEQKERTKRSTSKKSKKKKRKACRRRSMVIKVDEVFDNDIIFAPKSFKSYYCGGACAFPIAPDLNATNYAIVMSILHGLNVQGVRASQCVPTQLSPLSFLYIEGNKIIIKEYPDVVVEACGCR